MLRCRCPGRAWGGPTCAPAPLSAFFIMWYLNNREMKGVPAQPQQLLFQLDYAGLS